MCCKYKMHTDFERLSREKKGVTYHFNKCYIDYILKC